MIIINVRVRLMREGEHGEILLQNPKEFGLQMSFSENNKIDDMKNHPIFWGFGQTYKNMCSFIDKNAEIISEYEFAELSIRFSGENWIMHKHKEIYEFRESFRIEGETFSLEKWSGKKFEEVLSSESLLNSLNEYFES